MKKQLKVVLAFLLLFGLIGGSLWAAGEAEQEDVDDDVLWVEFWRGGTDTRAIPRTDPHPQWLAERFGVSLWRPAVPWDSGNAYIEQLRLRVAEGNLPDAFLPLRGIEYELAEQGALMELSELIPEHAPYLWENVPEEVWEAVRLNSPDGESIYYIPSVNADPLLSGFIRTDWLNRVGIDEIPQTIEEYEVALRAFAETDLNGTGTTDDVYPTTGRQNGRWMDHLFAPFGVAMVEGFPEWHVYDGELTYSAVTDNMRSALEWIRGLYAEGLLDPETFLNTSNVWNAKIRNNEAGSWFHGSQWSTGRINDLLAIDENAHLSNLPPLQAEGYDGFYSYFQYRRPEIAFAQSAGEDKVAGLLRIVDWYVNPANIDEQIQGIEGFNYVMEDGVEVRIAPPSDAHQAQFADILPGILNNEDQVASLIYNDYVAEEIEAAARNAVELVRGTEGRPIFGQFLPATIYDGYPELAEDTLYFEYATNIIIGDWPIESFDDFVEQWYAEGGDVVTERARAIHNSMR